MRPRKVTMRAFGPYAAEQVVDFRDLKGHALFLISGPTGAGKTSVLDAMCFALFGEATGADRKSDSLRSDHAAASMPTEVVFDFDFAGTRYRVSRSPKQMRPKSRGKGLTEQAPKATLWSAGLSAPDADDGDVLATGKRDVTAALVELLGFQAEQFRQVVMIPQGEFRKLLSAEVNDREKILRKLFGTVRLQQVAEVLKRRQKAVDVRLKSGDDKRAALLADKEVQSVEELRARIEQGQREVARLSEAVSVCEKTEQTARLAHDKAAAGNEALVKRTQAEQAIEALDERRAEVEVQRAELALALAAAEVRPKREFMQQRAREHTEAKAARKMAGQAQHQAKQAFAAAAERLVAQQKREPERTKAQQAIGKLETHRGKAEQLAAAERASEEAQTALDDASTRRGQAEAALEASKVGLAEAEAALEAVKLLAAQVPALRGALEKARAVAEKASSLEQSTRQREAAQKRHVEQEEATDAARKLVQTTAESLALLRSAWAKGQAIVLARQLADEEPCPVCGSVEHPSPASGEQSVPEQEAIDKMDGALQQATAALERESKRLSEGAAEQAAIAAKEQALRDELGEQAAVQVSALVRAQTEAAASLEQAEQAERAQAERQSERDEAKARLTAAEEALTAARTAHGKAETERETSRAVTEEMKKALPKALRRAGALAEALEQAHGALSALTEAIERAQTEEQTARLASTAAEATLTEATAAAQTAEERAAEAESDWREARAQAGFETDEAFDKAEREPAARKVLDQQIRAFDESRTRADERLKEAREKAKGLEPVPMDPLKVALAAAQEARMAAVEARTTEAALTEAARGTARAVDRIDEARTEDLAERNVIARLAAAATGDNGAKMSFERFVLAAFLEDVLIRATARLSTMSRGRYTLHRATGVRNKSKKGGLDLDVRDAYTGRSRPVGTLSGGEGFEASLALALGMADVVQAQSGGIHLDALFVDEGFGSLGGDDLEAVMSALEDLKAGGRLVGVISHVTELSERIAARLEVDKGKSGSRARFVVP